MTSLILVIKKIEREDRTTCDTFYSHSKAETIINESNIDDNVFKSIYTTVVSNIQKFLGKCLGSIISSITEHNINISSPNMRRCSDVSFRFHIGWDVADHAETSSQRRNWYLNATDLFEMSLLCLIAT